MDCRRREVGEALGVRAATAARAAGGQEQSLGPEPDRCVHPCAIGTSGPRACSARGQANACPPRLLRRHRTAADQRASRGVSQRYRARRLAAARRFAAGVAPLRRALGPALARPGAVCGDQQLRARRPEAQCLEVPRLCHSLVERRQAVRPISPRAAGRRRAGRGDRRFDHRHRLLSPWHLGR